MQYMKIIKIFIVAFFIFSLGVAGFILESDYYQKYKIEQKRVYVVKDHIEDVLGCDVKKEEDFFTDIQVRKNSGLVFTHCRDNMPLTNAGIQNSDILVLDSRVLDYTRLKDRTNPGFDNHDTFYYNLIVDYQYHELDMLINRNGVEKTIMVSVPNLNLSPEQEKHIPFVWRHFIHP